MSHCPFWINTRSSYRETAKVKALCYFRWMLFSVQQSLSPASSFPKGASALQALRMNLPDLIIIKNTLKEMSPEREAIGKLKSKDDLYYGSSQKAHLSSLISQQRYRTGMKLMEIHGRSQKDHHIFVNHLGYFSNTQQNILRQRK